MGDYRMGDNDTRTDAKRLALLDAKRLALEQAGTYVESISEVKSFNLMRDELQSYTAGTVEVVEQATHDTIEGNTHVVHVKVIARIDTDVVTRQIDAFRKNVATKEELLRLRAEKDQLRQLLDQQTHELKAVQTKTGLDVATRVRQQLLNKVEAKDLVTRAWKYLDLPQSSHQARALLQQALELDPEHVDAYRWLGYMDKNENKLDEAVREYRHAVRLIGYSPDNWPLYKDLGLALLDFGDLPAAVEALQEAYRLELKHCRQLADAGSVSILGFAIACPESSLFKSMSTRHHLLSARVAFALQLEGKGNLEAALAQYNAVFKVDPDNFPAHTRLGETLKKQGDLGGAVEHLRQAMRQESGWGGPHYALADVLRLRGNFREAIQEYREAIRLKDKPLGNDSDTESRYHNDLGLALYESGDFRGALAAFQEAQKLFPADPIIRENVRGAQARITRQK